MVRNKFKELPPAESEYYTTGFKQFKTKRYYTAIINFSVATKRRGGLKNFLFLAKFLFIL